MQVAHYNASATDTSAIVTANLNPSRSYRVAIEAVWNQAGLRAPLRAPAAFFPTTLDIPAGSSGSLCLVRSPPG